MKALTLILMTIISINNLPGLDNIPAISTDTMLTDIEYFSSLSERYPGTKDEKLAADYIKKRLGDIPYREEALSGFEDVYSFSRNIIVEFKGTRPDTILLAVPLNVAPVIKTDDKNLLQDGSAFSISGPCSAERYRNAELSQALPYYLQVTST